jgi:hypothetical protein
MIWWTSVDRPMPEGGFEVMHLYIAEEIWLGEPVLRKPLSKASFPQCKDYSASSHTLKYVRRSV